MCRRPEPVRREAPQVPCRIPFVDAMRGEGHAAERCQVAARTYRLWAQPDRVLAEGVVSDSGVEDKVREVA